MRGGKPQALEERRQLRRGVRDEFWFKYISYDKMVNNGECIKQRPDFLFDCTTHYVVLEVDENQHKQYVDDCEKVRMINISQALGMQTLFLRFNPDDYKVAGNKKETSMNTRLKDLKENLEYHMFGMMDELPKVGFLSVKYLYYDDYVKQNQKIETILKMDA